MSEAARRAGDGGSPPRPFLLAAIVAAHAALIWLLMTQRPPIATMADPQPILALFDLPRPLVEPLPPPPPPPIDTVETIDDGGGSPGIRRERAARNIDAQSLPAPALAEATPMPLAPPRALPMPAGGSAPMDLGAGRTDGRGTGSGSGTGAGTGSGAGGDQRDEFAIAEWIRRPHPDVARPYWPDAYRVRRLPADVTAKLRCQVRRSGAPYACKLLSETPRLGFRDAALAMARASLVRPVSRNGTPLWDVPVIITIVFETIAAPPG